MKRKTLRICYLVLECLLESLRKCVTLAQPKIQKRPHKALV